MTTTTTNGSFRTVFLADWVDVVFAHFEVDAEALAQEVPLDLDLWHGHAYVSLVAFTQKRLRPRWAGRIGQWLSAPVGDHEFLNVRTYVRVHGERGICFMVEWVPNRLAKIIGPRLYGLPYRLGTLSYSVDEDRGIVRGDVCDNGRLSFTARLDDDAPQVAQEGSLDEFLLERYTAFTSRNGILRRFRISHEPWDWVRAACEIGDRTLLAGQRWTETAHLVTAHFSIGLRDVRIGGPDRAFDSPTPRKRRSPAYPCGAR